MFDLKTIAVYLFIYSIAYRFLLFPKKIKTPRGFQLLLLLGYNVLLAIKLLPMTQITFFIAGSTFFLFIFYPQLEAKKILDLIIRSDGSNEKQIESRLKRLFILTIDFKAFKSEHGLVEYFLKVIKEQAPKAEPVDSKVERKAFIKRKSAHITMGILAILLFMFFLTEKTNPVEKQFNLIKYGGNFYDLVLSGEYFRLFSSIFLHANWAHILMNGFAIFYLGMFLERITKTRANYLSLFIVGGTLASLSSFLLGQQNSVGASGSVFALVGALFSIIFLSKDTINGDVRKRILKDVAFIVVINIAFGLSIENIDNYAHMGGLVAGAVLAFILYKFKHEALFRALDLIAIVIIVYGTVFWLANVKQSYPKNIKFTQNISIDGIPFKAPEEWSKTKAGKSVFYQDFYLSRFIFESINTYTYEQAEFINESNIKKEFLNKEILHFDNLVTKINGHSIRIIKFKLLFDKKNKDIRVGRIYYLKYKEKLYRFTVVFLEESYEQYGDIMIHFLEHNLK